MILSTATRTTPSLLNACTTKPACRPFALPAAATQIGFISRSKDGSIDNANALRFEDKAGAEQIWLHAERNMDTEIEGDETHIVEGNRYKRVDGNETTKIGGNRTETVDGNESITIHGNRDEVVDGNETITVHGERVETVDGNEEITLKSDQKIAILGSRTEQVDVDETITVKGNRTETVNGNETVNIDGVKDETITGHSSQKILGGEDRFIMGGKSEIIIGEQFEHTVGNYNNILLGDSRQIVLGKYNLFSPTDITLKSSTKVDIIAPEVNADGTKWYSTKWNETSITFIQSTNITTGLNTTLNTIAVEANGYKADFTPLSTSFEDGGLVTRCLGNEISIRALIYRAVAIMLIH